MVAGAILAMGEVGAGESTPCAEPITGVEPEVDRIYPITEAGRRSRTLSRPIRWPTRRQVAAHEVDVRRLAAAGDRSFTYSFGDGGDPVEHWRRLEAEGAEDPPLRYLVEMLRAPHRQREVEGQRVYVWPSAFTYDDWTEGPEADRAALHPLYGDEHFASFDRFGGYVGYRIGIAEDGEWLYFVAGD